jgi:hypothetical protein
MEGSRLKTIRIETLLSDGKLRRQKMKRLAVLCVVLMAMGMCAPSYGYVLVYDLFGMVRSVDVATNEIDRSDVRGYLAADIDEASGAVTATEVVLYGRDAGNNRVYIVTDAVNMTMYGNNAAVVFDNGLGVSMILTGGRARQVSNIGLSQRMRIITTMEGSMHIRQSALFDTDMVLVGSGGMSAMLDSVLTRGANRAGEGIDEVVNDIASWLESRGFVDISEEEPPVPNDPGDGDPIPN